MSHFEAHMCYICSLVGEGGEGRQGMDSLCVLFLFLFCFFFWSLLFPLFPFPGLGFVTSNILVSTLTKYILSSSDMTMEIILKDRRGGFSGKVRQGERVEGKDGGCGRQRL